MKRTLSKLQRAEHVALVAFGDSNTEVTFHTRGHLNWVGLLSEAIFETYGNGICTLINSGKCGGSYRDGIDRLPRDVLRYEPDLVILAFGMNDAAQGLVGLKRFEQDAKTTIRTIRDTCDSEILIRTPNPIVTVHGLPLPAEQPQPGKPWEHVERPLAKYAEKLVAIASEENCPVIDHYGLWSEKKFDVRHKVADSNALWPRMSDAIHPGALGHLTFFREMASMFCVPAYFPWEGL